MVLDQPQDIALDDVLDATIAQPTLNRIPPGKYSGVLMCDENRNEMSVKLDNIDVPSFPVYQSTVRISRHDVAKQVIVEFLDNQKHEPIITGVLEKISLQGDLDTSIMINEESNDEQQNNDLVGTKLSITGTESIELKSGASSITLTKSGKVLIKGDFISSRSRGMNRIKGGSIQLN